MAAAAFSYRTKENSSGSDSEDSDKECHDWKRAARRTNDETLEKIPVAPMVETPAVKIPTENTNSTSKRKRNHIWCDVLEDQMMSETLTHVGLKTKPKGYGSRGEESYDYTLKYKFSKKEDEQETSDEEMSDGSETSSVMSHQNKKFKNNKYRHFQLDDAGLTAARKIIKTLGEQKKYLIYRVVKHIGIEKAMKLLKMTEEIEENGGLMIRNNARRRTPGGVYFQLLKSEKDISKEAVDKIFEGELNSFEMKRQADERRKKKKLANEKASLLKTVSKEINVMQKQEDTKVESMVVEEEEMTVNEVLPITNDVALKGSDLEDGEIGD